MIVLGIETSCDETGAALVTDMTSHSDAATPRILGEALWSQLQEHRAFGGVVPEIAARAHLHHLDRVVRHALDQSGISLDAVDGVAATGGPGLIGGVLVGVSFTKSLALVKGIPFVAVNHLEGHALTARLVAAVAFPFLLLLVSGGHCQLLLAEGVGRYRRLGTTIDDAAGEAFDKGAKLLGLGYPGGPAIERLARTGDPARFPLPRPMRGRPGADFSFSGLKTALRLTVERLGDAGLREEALESARSDLAASLQGAIGDCLVDRTANALGILAREAIQVATLVVAGGVAANQALRGRLEALASEHGLRFCAPPPRLCTDNGAMIAWAGLERLRLGLQDGLDFAPRPRWPLDPDARPAHGAGLKA